MTFELTQTAATLFWLLIAVLMATGFAVAGWFLRGYWRRLRPPWRLLVVLCCVAGVYPPVMGALQTAGVLDERASIVLSVIAPVLALLGLVAVGLLWLRDRRRAT